MGIGPPGPAMSPLAGGELRTDSYWSVSASVAESSCASDSVHLGEVDRDEFERGLHRV